MSNVFPLIEIEVHVPKTSDMAVCIDDGDRYIWIPRSLIIEYDVDDCTGSGTMVIPEWIAIENGLV